MLETLGNVNLITDIVIVKYNVSTTSSIVSELRDIKEKTDILTNTQMSNTGLKDFLNKINARLGLVLGHDSRQHAKRQRRSMLPWGGDILHGLFGLATDATVEDTNRRLETIEHWAANRGTLVEKAINNINLHSQALQNMSLALDKLVLALNENREVVNELVMLTQFSLQAEDSLNEFTDLQESLILAQRSANPAEVTRKGPEKYRSSKLLRRSPEEC